MVDTGFAPLSATVDKTNRVLRDIEEALGWPKERRNQSYAALRAVLHAVRDRLTVDEAAHVAAQLPVLIRGIYYDGWDPSRAPRKMSREEFLERVRKEFHFSLDADDLDAGTEQLVRSVVGALRRHLSTGEWSDVVSSLPKKLKVLLA
jgi:uncharacterized protein (DUF2267 family)